jgi:hypothetical protein
MRTVHPALPIALVLGSIGCTVEPPEPKAGPQSGALRNPTPPVDYKELDMRAAVEEALQFGGLVTMAAAWRGHVSALELGQQVCPQVWAGAPDSDLVNLDLDPEAAIGLSWLADCATDPGATTYDGFTYWETSIDGDLGSRTLIADAIVTDASGGILFEYDGSASDSLDLADGSSYSSGFAGVISGSLAGIGSGLRAQNNTADAMGGFQASWSADGTLTFDGSVEAFDGFGPPDNRPADAPELEDLIDWAPGIPRFTSARFQLFFEADCASEPHGYIGLRGNEGFWFDVYFLPLYDVAEDTAQSNAYPYEQIDNLACDGVGTLFARNVDLEAADAEDDSWSRELSPDFASVVASLPTPTLADYVYTLRHLPEN